MKKSANFLKAIVIWQEKLIPLFSQAREKFCRVSKSSGEKISDPLTSLMARPHCKLPGQISGAAWPSGLVGQLKYPRVDEKPSCFITSNEADQLCHPIWLNVGKHQRKVGQLRSLEGLCMHVDYDYQYQKMEWMNEDVVILH